MKDNTIQIAKHTQFVISKWNVRKPGGGNVDELEALILSAGRVLQNVIAYRQIKKGVETGLLEIVAGGRRWRAVKQLIANGDLTGDLEMNWLEISEAEAIEMSLAENTGREPMHPADEFEAMRVLIKKGKSIADVAAAFGIEPIVVQRRLKLANIFPTIMQLYREHKATLTQLEALAITDDHARAACPKWNRTSTRLKELLTSDNLSIKDKVVRYVGVAAYEKERVQLSVIYLMNQVTATLIMYRYWNRWHLPNWLNKKRDYCKRGIRGWILNHVRIMKKFVVMDNRVAVNGNLPQKSKSF